MNKKTYNMPVAKFHKLKTARLMQSSKQAVKGTLKFFSAADEDDNYRQSKQGTCSFDEE